MQSVRKFFYLLHLVTSVIIGAVWLIALYLATAYIAVGTLSAIQMRQAVLSDDKHITFAELDRVREDFERRQFQIDRLVFELADLEDRMWALKKNSQSLAEEITNQIGNRKADYSQLAVKSQVSYVKTLCGSEYSEHAKCIEWANIEEQLSERQRRIDYFNSQLNGQRDDTKNSELNYKQYASLMPIATFMEFWGYREFLVMPDQILVLLLTMAMGALGSVVSMTWAFIDHDRSVTFRRFCLMPFVGVISAFVIFVVLKAGQITISSGDQTDSLDPFFLSFVGIISGLLSERAYARIASLGRNFFTTAEEEQRRWGVRLREAVAIEGIGPADLAAYVGVDREEMERIIDEQASANLQQQRLIAASLRRSARQIFTDIGPQFDLGTGEDDASKLVDVPNLIGKDAATLEPDLIRVGLTLGAQREISNSEHPRGHVIAQEPPPGTRVAFKRAVDITVSSGPE